MGDLFNVNIIDLPRRRRLAGMAPIVDRRGDRITLQFQVGEVQSEMSASDPNHLVLSYTRAMTAFTLFHREPKHIAMIGLGGGSIAKWCYHHLPHTFMTVIEINPKVISLRDRFCIPPDDHRFRVICQDGANYVAASTDSPEVLLVDGFDIDGQPPQLCTQMFYDDCYRVLDSDGLLVVNLVECPSEGLLARIRKSFHDLVFVVRPEAGGNSVVFAAKGKGGRHRMEDRSLEELVKRSLLTPVSN